MKPENFYAQLFRPIHERIGPIDETDIIPFVGFDRGGMVRLSTVSRGRAKFVTYITCELAARAQQQPARFGTYEVMIACDDEPWARWVLTEIGRMSFKTAFEHGHAMDIGEAVGPGFPLQGVIIEEFARVSVDGRPHGIHRLHGVTRAELDFAVGSGTDKLLQLLKDAGIYPLTSIHRGNSVAMERQELREDPPTAHALRARLRDRLTRE